MSTRAMAQYYSRQAGRGGFPDLDLFGLGRKRRLNEAQDLQNVETEGNIKLENTRSENILKQQQAQAAIAEKQAREKAIIDYLISHKFSPYDPFGNINPIHAQAMGALDPRMLNIATNSADVQGLRTGMERDLLSTPQGKSAFEAGMLGTMRRPAAETANLMTQRVGPNEIARFADANDLQAPLRTGIGASTETMEYEPVWNQATGKTEMMPKRRSISSPGIFMKTPQEVAAAKAQAEFDLKNNMSSSPYNTGGNSATTYNPPTPPAKAALSTGIEKGSYFNPRPDEYLDVKLFNMLKNMFKGTTTLPYD